MQKETGLPNAQIFEVLKKKLAAKVAPHRQHFNPSRHLPVAKNRQTQTRTPLQLTQPDSQEPPLHR
jgi:hypothetical protein